MKSIYMEKFGNLSTAHYYNPGVYLDDHQLLSLQNDLIFVNSRRAQPIKHPFLQNGLTLDVLRKYYASMIIGLLLLDQKPVGFLISPILLHDNLRIVHSGLVVISQNHGENLLGLVSLGLAKLIWHKLGRTYVTNISSTPSIIETFSRFVAKPWPDPDAKLIKPPAVYRRVFHVLYDQYLLKYFPNAENICCDDRRFVIQTSSQEMGFNINRHQLSRPADFKYMNFCFTWIDYAKEEDIVQVGVINAWLALRANLLSKFLKYLVLPWRGFNLSGLKISSRRPLGRPSHSLDIMLSKDHNQGGN